MASFVYSPAGEPATSPLHHSMGRNCYLDERDRRASERRLVHRLEALGYTVHLERPAA